MRKINIAQQDMVQRDIAFSAFYVIVHHSFSVQHPFENCLPESKDRYFLT
jgi:hypothetical protein